MPGFESVAATGRQNPSGAAPQQTAKHRSFQDLLNRALGKQDKQSGAQPVQQPQQTGNVPYGQGQRFPNNGQNAQGGGNAMNSQNPYNNPQYGMGQRFPERAEHAEHERAVQQPAVRHEPALPECTVRSAGAADGRKPALQYGV